MMFRADFMLSKWQHLKINKV